MNGLFTEHWPRPYKLLFTIAALLLALVGLSTAIFAVDQASMILGLVGFAAGAAVLAISPGWD